jgi:hypothetical protein
MSREEFQKSKQDVLDYVASLIGVDSATLSSQVSHSSDASSQANSDRTDAPAGDDPQPLPNASAGASYIEEASVLPDDWRDTYITQLTGPTTRAMSIMTRDHNAIQMIGDGVNAAEREWMRQVATLTVKRDKGKLKIGEFEAALDQLKTIPLSAIMGAQHAAARS